MTTGQSGAHAPDRNRGREPPPRLRRRAAYGTTAVTKKPKSIKSIYSEPNESPQKNPKIVPIYPPPSI